MRKDVKKEIIEQTIRLIEERGADVAGITIRDISAAAGVGVGLINYHFGTKEELIRACVQVIVGDTISRFGPLYEQLENLPPMEKLRFLAKKTCSYLEQNRNISEISILSDFMDGGPQDNTSQTVAAYLPVVRELCPAMPEELLKTKTVLLVHALQGVFLRADLYARELGRDYHDDRQREELIDRVLDLWFQKNTQ